MYNLIVAGRDGTWDGRPYRLELSRFGEYTENAVAEKYKSLDQTVIADLQSFPALFAYEQGHNADARVGLLQRITSRSGQVQIDYAFYPELSPIPASAACRSRVGARYSEVRDESHSLGRQGR